MAQLGMNMTKMEDIDAGRRALAELPESLIDRPHAATRHLCLGRKPGRLTVILQRHSVKETAARLEYADPFVFSRQFRKVTGVSPRHYQRDTRG